MMSFPKSLKNYKLISLAIAVIFTLSIFAAEDTQKLGPKAKRDLRSANMYLSQEIYDKAEPLYKSVIEENPLNVEALEKLAGIYYQVKKDYITANEYYSKALAAIDSIYTIHEELKKQDEKQAEDFYDDNIDKYDLEDKQETLGKLKNNCWLYIYKDALNYYKQQDFDTAITKYKTLYQETPDSANVVQMIANSYLQKQDNEKALEWLVKAAALKENDADLASQIANLYFNQKKFEEAANWYEKAAVDEPENPNHFYNMAVSYSNAKNYEKAYESYKKVIELESDNLDAIMMANSLAVRLNKTEESIELLKKAADLDPNNIDVLSILSYQLFKQKDYEGVLNYAKKWYDVDNSAKEAVQLLYQSARNTNKPELTKKYEQLYKSFEQE
jgi:tetratricopeptide (TPR) repeat protein